MKRLIAILLCCFMLLPFCLPLSTAAETGSTEPTSAEINAVENTSAKTTHLYVEKTVFELGDPIMVTPYMDSTDKCWVGIVPEKNGQPFYTGGAIFWKYIKSGIGSGKGAGAGDGVAVDLRLASPITDTKDDNLKYTMTYKTDNLPAGNYYIIFVTNNGVAKNATEYIRITIKPEIEGAMKLEKTVFKVGEPIMVTPTATNTNDWVGIIARSNSGATTGSSIRYRYINTADGKGDSKGLGNGVAVDLREAYVQPGSEAMKDLPAGNYYVVFVEKNGGVGSAKYKIPITIVESNLTLNKTVFKYGEPILASAIGSANPKTDWIGVQRSTDQNPATTIRWEYLANITEWPYNLRTCPGFNKTDKEDKYIYLPAGNYTAILVPNNGAFGKATFKINFTVTAETVDAPVAPVSAAYTLNNNTDGFADGNVTVKLSGLSAENAATDIVMYWGDANGRLEGYTALAQHKVTGEVTTIAMTPHTLIPTGATKLLVYASNVGGLSDPVEIALPTGAAAPDLGKAVLEFQVGSDLHLIASGSATDLLRQQHTKDFLKDITKNSPDSKGIIINGDLTDYGALKQYQLFLDIMQELLAEGYSIPDIHYAIGNHEFFNGISTATYGDFATQLRLYLQGSYAVDNKTTYDENSRYEHAYRDFFIDGYHFILLSSDEYPDGKKATKAMIHEEQLNWLREVLAANKNASKPTFVFLHQPMRNTVSGSLDAQGWEGVEANTTAALKEIFKDYPEIMFFNGHTHWDMNDENNLYYRDGTLPTILNTAAVGYLWSSYDKAIGVHKKGSQSYYIYVYADQVIVRGWDNETHEWIPSAYYSISYTDYEENNDTETAGAKAEGMSLTLGDRIGINAYFTFSDEVLADSTAVMRFTMPGGEITEIPLANATRRMLQGKITLMFSVDVAPAQMADTVTFQLTRSGTGTGKTYTYSVQKYADYILSNREKYVDAAPLVEAMLYYGSLAKGYFKYEGTGKITLDEETLAALNSSAAALTPNAAFRAAKSGTLPEGLTYTGSTLLLDSAVVVRHYFKPAEGKTMDSYTFTAAGKTLAPVEKNGLWYVDLPAKTVADFGTYQSLTVGGFTLSYSPMSYIFAVLSAPEKYDSTLVTLARGFALYYQTAVTYFHL